MKKICLFLLILSMYCLSFAQQKDTLKIENERFDFQYKKLYVPAGLMVTGIIAGGHGAKSWDNEVVAFRNKHFADFKNHGDDYLQFLPFIALYGFQMGGMKPKTDWKNRTAILIKGELLNLGLVYFLKTAVNKTRPDGSFLSFPSGHTADAFAGATILSIEYGENYHWVPYVAYGTATAVGVMRMANNKHYISDVLFGAGLGILSMKAAYWTHQYKWSQPKSEQDPLTILYTFPEK